MSSRLPAVAACLLLMIGCSSSASFSDGAPAADLLVDRGVQIDGVGSHDGPLAAPDAGQPVCDPRAPRATAPELLIGPTGMLQTLLAKIGAAQSQLSLMMYQLSVSSLVDALIAAHKRGVKVRVLLDADQKVNATSGPKLSAAGVAVKSAPARFNHAHAKVLIIDGGEALVMSGNFNNYTMNTERNYGVFIRDGQDLGQLAAIFERDWANGADPDLSCTRLIVSPVNARDRIGQLIQSAQQALDLAVMYISDGDVLAAVKARAAAGVAVRVLLAHPGWIGSNVETAANLAAAGIPVRYLETHDLHAKLIIADGVPLVGSHNMSWTSIEKNREVGLLVSHASTAQAIKAQFEADWKAGKSP